MNRKQRIILGIGFFTIVAGSVYFIPSIRHQVRTTVEILVTRFSPRVSKNFPLIDTKKLTFQQAKIINLVRLEYLVGPSSYDSEVLKYTQGHQEAWCADFISWVMLQSGMPLVNPNSGGWRIPGVYTLRDYFMSKGRYAEVGTYIPRPGDVAFYIGKHTFDLFSTEHATIVIKVDGNTMTTIGGNEGGRLRLDTQAITAGENSLVGFGKL